MRSVWVVLGCVLGGCGDDGNAAADALAAIDATIDAPPDAGVPACGTAALASTTFDVRPDYLGGIITGGTYAFSNGRFRIDITTANRNQQWTSRYGWDLHETSLMLEIAAVPRQDLSPGAYVTYRLVSMVDATDYVEIDLRNSQLTFRSRIGAAEQQQALPWGSQMQWRIREAAGSIVLDVGDGTTWTTGLTVPTRAAVASLGLHLQVGTGAITEAPGPVEIESLQGAPASPGYCAASTLRDDFSAMEIRPSWFPQILNPTYCVLAVTAGEAVVTLPSDGFVCGFISTHAYDLRGSSAHVHVVEPSSTPNVQTRFEAEASCASYVFIYDPATGMVRCEDGGGPPLATFPYDTSSAWWRFRGDAGGVVFESSGDGMTWTTRATAPLGNCEASAMTLEFGLRDSAATSPATARFDDFNGP